MESNELSYFCVSFSHLGWTFFGKRYCWQMLMLQVPLLETQQSNYWK